MKEGQLIYQIGLTMIPKVGGINGKKLISYCGDAESVFKEKKASLIKIPGIGEALAKNINQGKVLSRAEKEIDFIEKNRIKALFFLDKAYPQRLKHCIDGPLMLYYKGNQDLNNSKTIAIVGSRRATEYGKEITAGIIEQLADQELLIISGLAYGIDTQAHKSAISNHLPTIAVLGHGLNHLYPSTNRKLADKMILDGGLITEFISQARVEPEHFPQRNRIIAGMSDAVIVIEAAKKGGALITAEIANSYNRDVFAVPGKIGDKYSEGCNWLIKTHKAALLQSGADIKYIMGWDSDKKNPKGQQPKLFEELTDTEQTIMAYLKEQESAAIDNISLSTKLPASKTAEALLSLEFKGLIKVLPGKMFKVY